MACLISDGFAASAWFSNSGLSHVQRYSSSLSGAAGLETTGFSSISGCANCISRLCRLFVPVLVGVTGFTIGSGFFFSV